MFSIAHGVLTKPALGRARAGLTTVSWVAENGDIETHAGHRVYTHFLEHSTALQPIAAFDFQRVTLTHDNGSYAVRAGDRVAELLRHARRPPGQRPQLHPRRSGARHVRAGRSSSPIMCGRTRSAAPTTSSARSRRSNGQPATVVGVAEPEFRGALAGGARRLWVPLAGEFAAAAAAESIGCRRRDDRAPRARCLAVERAMPSSRRCGRSCSAPIPS